MVCHVCMSKIKGWPYVDLERAYVNIYLTNMLSISKTLKQLFQISFYLLCQVKYDIYFSKPILIRFNFELSQSDDTVIVLNAFKALIRFL